MLLASTHTEFCVAGATEYSTLLGMYSDCSPTLTAGRLYGYCYMSLKTEVLEVGAVGFARFYWSVLYVANLLCAEWFTLNEQYYICSAT
jgi:hypothetical protein